METRPSRRDLLRTAGALASVGVAGGLAGCSSGFNPFSGGGGTNQIQKVPEDADAVTYANVEQVFADDGTRQVMNAYLEARAELDYYEGPEDFEGVLDQVEDESGLDPREAKTTVSFFEWGDSMLLPINSEFAGAIVTGSWAEDDVVDAVEESSGVSYDDDEYEGRTVYEPDSEFASWIGVLSEGEYVVTPTEDVLETVVDVQRGEEDKLDEELRQGYKNTRNAPVRYVGTLPDDLLPDEYDQGSRTLDFSAFSDVEYAAGSVYRNDDLRGVATTMTAEDEEAAEDVGDVVDGAVSLAEGSARDDTVTDLLDAVEVDQSGTTVTVTFEQAVDDLADYAEEAGAGPGGGERVERRVPAVSFMFDYEETGDSRGQVTVTHDGGDSVPRRELFVRGSGFASVEGVDMAGRGPWAGTASGEIEGTPAVVAGDRVVVGVRSDFEISVVWESMEGGTSATLATMEGPDA